MGWCPLCRKECHAWREGWYLVCAMLVAVSFAVGSYLWMRP